jgi:type IV pilus assembly protein PilN
MAGINLLPWRQWERERRKNEFLGQLGIAVAAAAVAVLGIGAHFDNEVDNQKKRNEFLRTAITDLEARIAEIKDLRDKRDQLIARMQVIQDLQGNRPVIVHVFDDLVRKLSDGAFFDSVKMEADTVSISGKAEANNRVSMLMRNLDGSDWFADPNLRDIRADAALGPQGSRFQLSVKQVRPKRDGDDEET